MIIRALSVIIALLSVNVAFSAPKPDWTQTCESPDGFSWTLSIPRSQIDKAPRWNPETGDIPLSPRKAYQKAAEAFRTIAKGAPTFIHMGFNAGIVDFPVAYLIQFKDSEDHPYTFVVFLDGQVVSPVIKQK
jgi:hypothetical protein